MTSPDSHPRSADFYSRARYHAFHEWSAAGYKINKGTSARWVDGIAMFAETQVTKSLARSIPSHTDYGNHWKGCAPKNTSPSWGYGDDDYDNSPDAYGFSYT